MLVLHIISGMKVGGAEMALQRLASHARGGRYEHVVASLSPGGAMRERFLDAGIELLVFDFKGAPLSSLLLLFRTLRQRRPVIVQTWMYHADLIGGVVAKLAGVPHVIWGIRSTDVPGHGARALRLIRAACARLSRRVPSVIACVAEAARRTHVSLGYDDARMRVVPNGFGTDVLAGRAAARASLRGQLGLNADAIVIGCVGRFHPDKGQDIFVLASAVVAQALPGARFLMVGRDVTDANPELMAWIAESGAAERFYLLGERSDMQSCLAAMDVFCLASRTEGFPNVVGEAMALQVPCVVTDAGDAALLVGDTAAVVPVADPPALGQALLELARMAPAQRSVSGQAARQRILAHYTMTRAGERFTAIYDELTMQG
ncbi:glycosyltransferase [Massilia sp. PAMC28688]|uniref:glycosyltransferase n=1 Tax=Massilia sp. PAMC28688 TaxID=2861283 RepID=UPI001C638950|nr:glycosyltransferase [Massilia sp. PAMC28688]QYF91986.1 glycosyltransferase [Massilia sp. PAMC28688]